MELRSSAALACSEESGRSRSAAAKRAGGMGVAIADMGGWCWACWSSFLVGYCEVLVIYEAVWRVGVGLELEMGGGDGWRRWKAGVSIRSAVASLDGEA